IVDINPKESKIARANAITPFMEAGNVWFPHPDEQPWVNDLIAELLAFPNGANDDQVDALTQALHRIYLSKKKVKTRRGLF
ncbi:phage terminase large subunit, partial [Erysipelothrix rhusiopathiae]|nr:phage terminase large subunit [Erysipelothrix rhusiopathiae]